MMVGEMITTTDRPDQRDLNDDYRKNLVCGIKYEY